MKKIGIYEKIDSTLPNVEQLKIKYQIEEKILLFPSFRVMDIYSGLMSDDFRNNTYHFVILFEQKNLN